MPPHHSQRTLGKPLRDAFFVLALAVSLAISTGAFAAPRPGKESVSGSDEFATALRPLFERYCFECHGEKKKGDLDLRRFTDGASILADRGTMQEVLTKLRAQEMPPKKQPQPSPDDRRHMITWIEERVFPVDCEHPDPGRVTLRRLNRVEYNNTIRDLVGVVFRPADDFPADDAGYGFDNIGDVLTLPPVLLEKYLSAAERILDEIIVSDPGRWGPVRSFTPAQLECDAVGGPYGNRGARALMREGALALPFSFPMEGDYLLRVRAFGQQAGGEPPRLEFRADGQALFTAPVEAVEGAAKTYETRLQTSAGERRLSFAYINNYVQPNDPDPNNRDRNLIVESIEVVGPMGRLPLPEGHRRIFYRAAVPGHTREAARDILEQFTRRAYRRPLVREELDRLLEIFNLVEREGETFEQSVKIALQAVLVSPHFLFRGERQPKPDDPRSVHPIDEFALASRLSYFLWSTMPDEELMTLAERGRLRRNLEAQVRRMLHDPKSRALVDHFAGQWLQLRNLEIVRPDAKTFPGFDDALRKAMRRETELVFEHLIRENRSVLEFLDADYTFVNERLARHYGFDGVTGEEFRKVQVAGTRRGGVLTHASMLTLTSNPTRTSPVKRGKWVLDNLLGAPPPPPPPDIPELDGQAALTGTLRERMEQHRQNPNCVSCHERMDPIGFGLENFDGIGAWRDRDGESAIDSTGSLVTGEAFAGVEELRRILSREREEEFVRCLAGKLLTYALGRGLEHYDRCAVDWIVKETVRRGYRFPAMILAVARSVPFQMRRGDDAEPVLAGAD